MTRFKKIPQNINEGKLIYNYSIVDGIVVLAVQEIPYVKLYSTSPIGKMSNNAVSVTRVKDGVHVDVSIKIHYTQSVSDTAFKIQEAVRHNVEAMTEYHVSSVNVLVCGIMFDEDTEEKTTATVNEN
jgi:uncharacterized alkaline shock family protein YloU